MRRACHPDHLTWASAALEVSWTGQTADPAGGRWTWLLGPRLGRTRESAGRWLWLGPREPVASTDPLHTHLRLPAATQDRRAGTPEWPSRGNVDSWFQLRSGSQGGKIQPHMGICAVESAEDPLSLSLYCSLMLTCSLSNNTSFKKQEMQTFRSLLLNTNWFSLCLFYLLHLASIPAGIVSGPVRLVALGSCPKARPPRKLGIQGPVFGSPRTPCKCWPVLASGGDS